MIHDVFCPSLSFFMFLFALMCFSAFSAGVCSSIPHTCQYQDSLFFLMVSDHFACSVLILSSSFVITCGHFMFKMFLWKVSTFFSLFLVNVYSSQLCRNIDVTYALKTLIIVLRLILLIWFIFSLLLFGSLLALFLSWCRVFLVKNTSE